MNFYIIALIIIMGNIVAAHLVNRRRLMLDKTIEADVKKDKTLRLMMKLVLVESVFVVAFLLLVVKPLLAEKGIF